MAFQESGKRVRGPGWAGSTTVISAQIGLIMLSGAAGGHTGIAHADHVLPDSRVPLEDASKTTLPNSR
jgi:hypothetical protein